MVAAASPTRRVLGDKPTNTFIHQRTPVVAKSFTLEHERKDVVITGKERTPQIGQKRSIEHVDGTEEHAQSLLSREVSLPLTEPEDEMPTVTETDDGDKEQTVHLVVRTSGKAENDTTEPGTAAGTAALGGKHDEIKPSPRNLEDMANPLSTSFHASQEGWVPIEEQFDIQDESSQRMSDNLNLTPLPLNSTESQTDLHVKSTAHDSQDSMKLSSFVDFDPPFAKEGEAGTLPPKPDPPPIGPARKAMMLEKAEALRTRLQLAAFKVQTNQIRTPFYWLHGGQVPPGRQPTRRVPQIKREERLITVSADAANGLLELIRAAAET